MSLLPIVLVLAAVHPPDAELVDVMSQETLAATYAQLGKAMGGDGKKDVTLRISSPGGDGIATLLFIDQVQDMKARQGAKVTCVASVMAASAAAILLESPVCDSRLVMPATVILFHGVRSGVQGKTGDMDDELKLLKDLDRAVANMVAPRLHMTPDAYLAWIDRHDRWLTPDELLAMGGADGIVRPEQGPTASGATPAQAPQHSTEPRSQPEPQSQARRPVKVARSLLFMGLAFLSAALLAGRKTFRKAHNVRGAALRALASKTRPRQSIPTRKPGRSVQAMSRLARSRAGHKRGR